MVCFRELRLSAERVRMSRRYDMGEQDTRAVSNRRKVTVKVCMLDDSVVKFDIEVSAYALTTMKV